MRYMAISDFASKDEGHLALQRGDVSNSYDAHYRLTEIINIPRSSLFTVPFACLYDRVYT